MNKKLYRDEYHKVLGGVCSGLAEYFEMDVTVIRLLFVFTVIIMGVGLVPYIILWIVLPKKGYVFGNTAFNNPTVDYTVPPQQPGGDANTPPKQPANPFGGNPFGGNPFGGNPYGGSPFAGNPVKTKQKSNAGLIVGLVLIIIGAAILIENYDLIPDFDFERLWPVILVIVGGVLIISGPRKQREDAQEWSNTDKKDTTAPDSTETSDNSSTTKS